jgi:penicillin G amidase
VTRIHELLDAGGSADVSGATRMQNDRQSLLARRILPVLREARPKTTRGVEALHLLKRWNGAMDADRPEPLIFAAWLDRLSRAIYADEVGAQAYARYAVPRPLFLDALLTRGGDAWCDNVKTVRRETCAELTGPALDDAMDELVRDHGANTRKWRWGDVHIARFAHPLFTGVPLVGGVFDVVAPVGGSGDTLAVAAYLGDGDFTAVHGPGARAVYDFADLDRSRFMVAPGQSGHVLSPHYRDLVASWAAGESFEVRTDWMPKTRPKGAAVLTLTPR